MDSDENANDKEACDFINHGYHHESNYKKKWHKENAERINKRKKDDYNPKERMKRHEKDKIAKVKMIKKICEMDSDETANDKEACDFINRDYHEVNYKKKWYKENAERINKRKRDNYEPEERIKRHEKDKVKKKRNEEITHSWVFKKGQVIEGDQNHLNYDYWARFDNRESKEETRRRFNNGYDLIYPPSIQQCSMGLKFLGKSECDEHTQAKLSALESQMEELFNLMENETSEVTKVAKEFVENDDIVPRDINDLYNHHKLRQCNNWHALQLKIDVEYQEIAQSAKKSFICKEDWHYCKIRCHGCLIDQQCLDHKRMHDKRFVKTLEVALERNDHLKRSTLLRFKIGLAQVENLKLTEEQSLKVKDMETKIGENHAMFVSQIHHIFDGDDTEIEKTGMFKLDKMPIRKELCDNWHHLQEDIKSNFDIIAKYF